MGGRPDLGVWQMTEHKWLTQRFAKHQDRLTALAYRLLGSRGDAEDAV
jgi:DNA-directed RNA polymerase specialized sigma24 family protein